MLFKHFNAKSPSDTARLKASPQFSAGRFQNIKQHKRKGKMDTLALLKRWLTEKKHHPTPTQKMPVEPIDKIALYLLDDQKNHLFRLGHSTVLLKLAGDFWLIDPVFSKRASPFQFFGPQRFHSPPISIDELPDIKGVIISHNHYDHLDKHSIIALKDKTELFFAPLGVDGDLEHWGVRSSQIKTFDWWQHHQQEQVQLTFTPAHHYSGRGLDDNSSTLWGSWVIECAQQKIFFSGDSGYFAGFKTIGERCGPIDLCLMETGAYDLNWPHVHMQPEQSFQAFLDIGAKQLMPIHNSTFDLAFHPWYEPLQKISNLSAQHSCDLLLPKIGERITLGERYQNETWWSDLNQEG